VLSPQGLDHAGVFRTSFSNKRMLSPQGLDQVADYKNTLDHNVKLHILLLLFGFWHIVDQVHASKWSNQSAACL
jgi:hypothetical protein